MWMYIVFKEVQKCVCQITETFKVHCPEYFFSLFFFFIILTQNVVTQFYFCSNQSVVWAGVEETVLEREQGWGGRVKNWWEEDGHYRAFFRTRLFPVPIQSHSKNWIFFFFFFKAAWFHSVESTQTEMETITLTCDSLLIGIVTVEGHSGFVCFFSFLGLEVTGKPWLWDSVCSQCQC